MASVLEVSGIEKAFGGIRAVNGVSFDVGSGEIFALLGPNGAGKTSIVRMLLGIIKRDGGEVRWRLGGRDEPEPSRIGYLPEDRGLYKDVPVLRTLTYFGVLRGMLKSEAKAEAERWLGRLDLSDRAKDKVDTLSKGNQQKVQFAAAVLHKPTFAVLDEPFSGLDPVNQDRFLDLIRTMRDGGATILLSAHQMQLVDRVADRLLLIDQGKQVLAGTLDEVSGGANARRRLVVEVDGLPDADALASCHGVERVDTVEQGRVVLVLEPDQSLNATLASLTDRVTIRSVHDERPTLHDIYVEAVRRQKEAAS